MVSWWCGRPPEPDGDARADRTDAGGTRPPVACPITTAPNVDIHRVNGEALMIRRMLIAIAAVAITVGVTGPVHAGEVTGNGTLKHIEDSKWGTGLHSRSLCAFSGQEDLQFFNEDGTAKDPATRGDPGHAQSWGQIPKVVRDELTTEGLQPGTACNPTRSGGEG
jgi:hypothetical protein